MENEIMLEVSHVSKEYRLGTIGSTTLQDDLQRLRAKLFHKEDPTLKIGQSRGEKGKTFMALSDISFTVKKGEAVGIIGHNGAGKSTLLKLITRITSPTEGEIGMNGRVASMLEVGTGFHPELTGRENIYMNGAILGMTKKEIDAKLEDIIEFSECGKFIDTPVKRYSSGMYVKLAFAVAAHLDSELLVMDEVLAVGDMKFQQKCLGKMDDVSKEDGKTILYVSHNMNTIRQLCSRCIVLDHGKLIFDGDVEQAIALYVGAIGELKVSYDYTNVPRSINDAKKLMMTGLDVLEREENLVQQGDTLRLVIHCKANADVKKARMRFEIFSQDNTIAGTMFTDRSFSVQKGQEIDIHVSVPTGNFATGKFKVVALTVETNEFGAEAVSDRVDPAMIFEVVDEREKDLFWQHQWWGYTKYDNMTIEKMEIL